MPIVNSWLGPVHIDEYSSPHPLNPEQFGNVQIWHPDLVNIYGSRIGQNTKVASFAEIGNSIIGRYCKIEAHAFIAPGTLLEDYVFVGPHASIQNDKYPDLLKKEWVLMPVTVKRGASIGGASVILGGVTIGEEARIGAGSVVTKDVPAKTVVYGNPARIMSKS